ncbi:hypothetical protein [Streptomyces virginiae]|uniref:hypothetical protein n=1 Tax=Streptomyces virginiae TaxID=1961 RepID=UPI000AE8AF33|nr:hypothetical protein [Streptomyces virginiae]
MSSVQPGSPRRTDPGSSESGFGESAPAPVFVDQSGLRGRLLRGFGWPVSVVGAILAVAMGSSLIGVQADAPAMGIPAQPSRSPAPSPSPTRSTPATAVSSSSSPRGVARSATPGAGATPGAKASATPPRTAAAPSKAAVTAPKPATTAQRGAKPSGRPAKQP